MYCIAKVSIQPIYRDTIQSPSRERERINAQGRSVRSNMKICLRNANVVIPKWTWCLLPQKGFEGGHPKRDLMFVAPKRIWMSSKKGHEVYCPNRDLKVVTPQRDLKFVAQKGFEGCHPQKESEGCRSKGNLKVVIQEESTSSSTVLHNA